MKKVGAREFKNRQSHYMRRASKGETLIVTARGKPLVQVGPVLPDVSADEKLEAKLRELAAQGHIRLARRPLPRFKPLPQRGKLASRIIIEDRK